ncbi:MAG TPA: formyltransferase family protein [Acidimicrobiia bacterium]
MIRFAFAGDRQSAVSCLSILLETDAHPEALLVSGPDRATHDEVLREMSGLPSDRVLVGREFREPAGIELLGSLDLDYVIGVHFPYIVPDEVLAIPRIGVLNLHPALLPYNRGWHTPSWAILDGTPIGATLHFMDSGLDTGDIVAQVELEIRPEDTAHTLYSRLLQLEVDLFRQAWPLLASGSPPRQAQSAAGGSSHNRVDLASDSVRRLDLEASVPVKDLLRTLRALTTNDRGEAAYFEVDGRRYTVQVNITPDADK